MSREPEFEPVELNYTEERLQVDGERYRLLVETINIGVFQSDLHGRFLYANQAIAQMAGCETIAEFMALPAQRLYANPADRQAVIQTLLQQGALKDQELRSLRKDGSTYWIALNAVLVKDSRGRPSSLLGFVRDISARKRTEQLLQARVQLREYAAEHTQDELLQKILDQAETITGSQIGFLHFLDPDQVTLELQMWSSNTLAYMCTAEGKGQHYPVDLAGVWRARPLDP